MKKQKLISISMLVLLMFSIGGAFAKNFEEISGQNKYSIENINQIHSNFMNKYQFNCTGECDYVLDENNKIQLQIREQKRFLFWDVNMIEEHELNENGDVIQSKYNFWSRLLNRNREVFN